jgi:bifunctional UDP-N-acetylglucosamine pyrophosphorylase/glucosamine-1-phosphate N-acetyltransferase
VIGENVRTGSQNVFVAPVTIGDGAWTAAGSAITDDIPPDALGVARAKQTNIENYARRRRPQS